MYLEILNATWRWYFAYDISDVYSNSVHLTKEDCIKMQQTRICASQQMKCINNDCVYEQLPTPDWNYLRSTQSHGIRCTFKSIMLLANDISTPLFVGNTPHVCLPKDTQCQLHTGIVIWSPDIIHEFNYDFILSSTFIVHSDDPNELNEGNLIYSEFNQLLLNLQSTIYENEVKLFTTSEGLFVMETQSFKDNQKRLNIKINDDNPKTIQQLALSDIDYKTHILLRFQLRFNRANCHFMQTILQIYKLFDNQFFTIFNIDGTKLVLYSMNQEIFIPHCIHVNEIQTIVTEDCYQHVPIQFKYNDILKLAFLDGNRIISDNAIIKPCQYNLQKIYLEDSKRLLEIVGNQITLGVIPVNSYEILNYLYTDFSKLNYKHNNELIAGIDLTNFYLSLNAIQQQLNDIPVLYFPSKTSILFEIERNKIFTSIKLHLKNIFSTILYILVGIITILLIILMLYYCCKHSQQIKRNFKLFHKKHFKLFLNFKKPRNVSTEEEIEMNILPQDVQSSLISSNLNPQLQVEEKNSLSTLKNNNESFVSKLKITPAYPDLSYGNKNSENQVRFRPQLV